MLRLQCVFVLVTANPTLYLSIFQSRPERGTLAPLSCHATTLNLMAITGRVYGWNTCFGDECGMVAVKIRGGVWNF